MENTYEHAALFSSRLLELNRTFQQLYAHRLQEIMLEQQQLNQQQPLWTSAEITPPSSPPSSTEQDRSKICSSSEQSPSSERSSASQSSRHTRTKIRFNPYQLQHRPKYMSALQAKDSVEVDLSYHEQMARTNNRSTEHRTPKELKRLEQNAYAGRVFRAKTRALQTLLKTEQEEAAAQNRSQKLLVAQKRAYINAMYQLLGLSQRDLAAGWENFPEQYGCITGEREEL